MKPFRRLTAASVALACLLSPIGCAFAETAAPTQPPADYFAPQGTAEVGSHGEVDQSALLDAPTVEPQETIDINEIIAEEEMLSEDTDVSGDPVAMDTGDEYVDGGVGADDGDFIAEETPESTEEPASEDPNQIAGNNSARRVDVSSVQFSALRDASLGFTFNYPSDWINVPGIRTVCFHAPAEEGEFPARITISVKRTTHTVENDVLLTQLQKFMRTISKRYAASTFQAGKINKKDSFLKRNAYSNTYLAYYGDVEVKGFIIGCGVGKSIVVGHFCASYEDYGPMKSLMRYMFNSAQLLSQGDSKKKKK